MAVAKKRKKERKKERSDIKNPGLSQHCTSLAGPGRVAKKEKAPGDMSVWKAQERAECGGLDDRCGVQDPAVGDRDLVVRNRDWPAVAPQ